MEKIKPFIKSGPQNANSTPNASMIDRAKETISQGFIFTLQGKRKTNQKKSKKKKRSGVFFHRYVNWRTKGSKRKLKKKRNHKKKPSLNFLKTFGLSFNGQNKHQHLL